MKKSDIPGDARYVLRGDRRMKTQVVDGGLDSSSTARRSASAYSIHPKKRVSDLPENVDVAGSGQADRVSSRDDVDHRPLPPTSDRVIKKMIPPEDLSEAPDRFLTETEAGRILGVSPRTLQAWRYAGRDQTPPYHVFGKCIRYRLQAVLEWAMSREIRSR